MLQLLRMVTEENFRKTEEEHRKLGYRGIYIWYGYNNYDHDVSQINSIARAIKKDFPRMTYNKMDVCFIEKSESIRHAHHTFVRIRVNVDDFLELKRKNMLDIL